MKSQLTLRKVTRRDWHLARFARRNMKAPGWLLFALALAGLLLGSIMDGLRLEVGAVLGLLWFAAMFLACLSRRR